MKASNVLGHHCVPAGPLNLLLLSASDSWASAVNGQARDMGITLLHTTSDAREAVTRLAGGFPPVSHLLMQASTAGEMLPHLVKLTAGEAPYGIGLVVLGDAGTLVHDPSVLSMRFVSEPGPWQAGQGWLRRVLAPGCHGGAGAAASDVAPDRAEHCHARLSVEELRDALRGARIQTRYQPIVRMADSRPVGLEVLARLDHPSRGILQPDLFVPQIEEAGLAWPLTEAVVRRAFADWDQGRLAALGVTLALNFPLDVLLIPEALVWLEARRKEAQIPADRLVIELTESRSITETGRLRQAVATLRGIGYGVAIDDVGPNIRDHQALLDLPFTSLKLDKDLVRESPDSGTAANFLTRTIAAARAANLTIVAEGVEDAATWGRMAACGIDQVQGFLVARPLPAAAVPLWHHDWCGRLTR